MYMDKYPCVYMRGGTSKAIIFHKEDLPVESRWRDIFLKTMGTPDPKQIDGMGGTVSSTSKIAVISPSERPGVDIDYYFVQVDIKNANISDNLNCGNISSAVGPFAIDEGLVKAVEPVTVVRIYNVNTCKIIESHLRVEGGKAAVYGETEIPGVPGTGSPIELYFERPAGASTGKTFPTGKKKEIFDVPDFGPIEVSVVDISNAAVFVRAKDIGMTGKELLEINSNKKLLEHLERIRCIAAEKIGFVNSQEAFSKYSQTKVIQENLTKEKNRLENEIKQKEVALQKSQLELQSKGNKLTDKEKQDFQKQVEAFQKFVRDSQTKLSKEEYTRMQEIEKTMNSAIDSVAKAGKYDYILEAGAVKFGGTDVTADVIKAMEKIKK